MRHQELAEEQEEDKQSGEYGQPDGPRALAPPDYRNQANDPGGQPAGQHRDAIEGQHSLPPGRGHGRWHEQGGVDDDERDESSPQPDRPPAEAGARPAQDAPPEGGGWVAQGDLRLSR